MKKLILIFLISSGFAYGQGMSYYDSIQQYEVNYKSKEKLRRFSYEMYLQAVKFKLENKELTKRNLELSNRLADKGLPPVESPIVNTPKQPDPSIVVAEHSNQIMQEIADEKKRANDLTALWIVSGVVGTVVCIIIIASIDYPDY